MPKGPNGEKRPKDTVSAAMLVAKIATREIKETKEQEKSEVAVKAGQKGGRYRSLNLKDNEKSKIAKKAAKARWDKNDR